MGAVDEFFDLLAEHRRSLDGDFVAAVEAQRFIERMEAEHPDVLAAWMQAKAVEFATVAIGRGERQERRRTFEGAKRRTFAIAAESSDPGKLELFRLPFVIDAEKTRRPLAEMSGRDCGFVAGKYEVTGRHDLAIAAFFRALEQKAGRKKVKSVILGAGVRAPGPVLPRRDRRANPCSSRMTAPPSQPAPRHPSPTTHAHPAHPFPHRLPMPVPGSPTPPDSPTHDNPAHTLPSRQPSPSQPRASRPAPTRQPSADLAVPALFDHPCHRVPPPPAPVRHPVPRRPRSCLPGPPDFPRLSFPSRLSPAPTTRTKEQLR